MPARSISVCSCGKHSGAARRERCKDDGSTPARLKSPSARSSISSGRASRVSGRSHDRCRAYGAPIRRLRSLGDVHQFHHGLLGRSGRGKSPQMAAGSHDGSDLRLDESVCTRRGDGRFRAVVHPENPAPTLANDVAAVALLMPTGTSLTTDGRRTGRDSGLVGGLQTARLTTALRDFQRGVVMAVPSVQQPPAGGGMPPVFVVGGVTNTFSYIPLL